MSMTTRNFFKAEQRKDDGPKGAGFVQTEDAGKPSVNDGASEQSPASLPKLSMTIQPKAEEGPAVQQSPAGLQGKVVSTVTSIVEQNYGKA